MFKRSGILLFVCCVMGLGRLGAQTITPLAGSIGQSAHPAIYHQPTNSIWVVGGWNSGSYMNEIRKYDIAANTWTVLTTANGVPSDLGSEQGFTFALNGKIYFAGGVDGGYIWWAKTYEYDPSTSTFTQKDNIPHPSNHGRAYGFSFSIDNKGYIGRGISNSNGSPGALNNTVLRFDPTQPSGSQWTTMTPYPGLGMVHMSFTTLDGYGYAGLGSSDPNSVSAVSDFWRYDPNTGVGGTWTQMASFPGGARQSAALVPICGKLMLIGGIEMVNNAPATYYQDVWEFDPAAGPTGAWRQLGNMSQAYGRWAPARVSTGTDIYYGLGYNWPNGQMALDWMRINFEVTAHAGARDTAICAGDAIELMADTVNGATYGWRGPGGFSNNTQNPVIPNTTATASGDYVLTVSLTGCGSDTDTVHISVYNHPVVDLGPDLSLCADSVVLRSSQSYTSATYLWSNGSGAPELTVRNSNRYWLQVTENGCTGSDTIDVTLNTALTINLGNDTSICERDAPYRISVTGQPPGTQFLWSTGFTTSTIDVTRTDTYWLEATLGSCKGSDTIHVKVIPTPTIHIGQDSAICEDQPATIGDAIPGASYLWSTGDTNPFIEVSASGVYWLEADLEGCKVRDTIQITALPLPAPDLGADGDICPEQEIVLDATDSRYPTATYEWNNGATTSAVSATEAGTYWVAVTSSEGCQGYDTITLSHYPLPTVKLGRDTTVCEEQPLLLQAYHMEADSLRWSDGTGGETLQVITGGEYIVTGINKCGQTHDTILIKQIFCDIWVPNAFTPNGDGVNDELRVLGNTGRLEQFHFYVYNRWGQLVFETTDRSQGWDGRQQGVEAPVGAYVYMLEYKLHGQSILGKGNVTLLR